MLPPTAIKMMKEVKVPFKYKYDLMIVASGGESLADELLSWGRETFKVDINELYGQTERNLIVGNSYAILPVKLNSMGVPDSTRVEKIKGFIILKENVKVSDRLE